LRISILKKKILGDKLNYFDISLLVEYFLSFLVTIVGENKLSYYNLNHPLIVDEKRYIDLVVTKEIEDIVVEKLFETGIKIPFTFGLITIVSWSKIKWQSAFVIPYRKDQNNQFEYLLPIVYKRKEEKLWILGGKRITDSTPVECAKREFNEETLGFYKWRNIIEDDIYNTSPSLQIRGNYFLLLKVDYNYFNQEDINQLNQLKDEKCISKKVLKKRVKELYQLYQNENDTTKKKRI